jgi:diguanylate cyclase (GGDEF)-like protein
MTGMAGMSVRRVSLCAALAIALIGCVVFAAGRIERDTAVDAGRSTQSAQGLLSAMREQESAARGFFMTRQEQFLAPWYRGATDFAAAIATARALDAGDPALRRALSDQAQRSRAWREEVSAEIDRMRRTGRPPTLAQLITDQALMEGFVAGNDMYTSQLAERRGFALSGASWVTAGLVAALSVALLTLGALVARRGIGRERARARRAQELRDMLQISGSAREANLLLIHHVERMLPASAAAVLAHGGDGDERLQATLTDRVDLGPLSGIQTGRLTPRSCLAMRLSRPYERGGDDRPLAPCEVCGKVAGTVACEPLLVGGHVIGSVLVARERRIGGGARSDVHEAVAQAAPILANLRTLELAEQRAVSDALTGLPNRRAADESIRRMAALSGRSLNPLAAIMLDLDRFKQLNDQHGHEFGDRALAMVGQVLTSTIRASDFAARYGGEEFLLLLPETDRTGAIEVAEKIRRAIERIELPRVGALTASFGVAALPEDAVEPGQLLRRADRALYAAKARGRNRVEAAQPAGFGGLGRGDSADPHGL